MSGKRRAVCPVSFNLTDPYEKELYGFAVEQQKYFSRYVKRLIENDRYAKANMHRVEPVVSVPENRVTRNKIDKSAAASFL